MKKFTALELANVLGVDRDSAYSLIVYLEKRGHVERDGKRPNDPGVRGRGQAYFKVPEGKDLGLLMGQDMETILNAPEPVVAAPVAKVVVTKPTTVIPAPTTDVAAALDVAAGIQDAVAAANA